jgi:hypothetical protein
MHLTEDRTNGWFCENDNEPSNSIKGEEFLDYLRDSQLLNRTVPRGVNYDVPRFFLFSFFVFFSSAFLLLVSFFLFLSFPPYSSSSILASHNFRFSPSYCISSTSSTVQLCI